MIRNGLAGVSAGGKGAAAAGDPGERSKGQCGFVFKDHI